jgi:hypothetical protein
MTAWGPVFLQKLYGMSAFGGSLLLGAITVV